MVPKPNPMVPKLFRNLETDVSSCRGEVKAEIDSCDHTAVKEKGFFKTYLRQLWPSWDSGSLSRTLQASKTAENSKKWPLSFHDKN